MKTLTELSFQQALATPESRRAALDFAEAFTRRHGQTAELAPAAREAEMLAVQFPRILQPIESGDLFAGRIRYGLVGLSLEPCGLGYFCALGPIRDWLARGEGELEERMRFEGLLDYWDGRTTASQVRAAYPPEVAERLPSDNWTEDSGVAFPLYRMAGTVLDYGKLLALGLDALEREVCETAGEQGEERGFYAGLAAAIDVLRGSIDHYAEQAEDAAIAQTLWAVRHDPPGTFREAIQLLWLYALHAGTWNYGRLDDVLGPYLARDLDSGRISEDEALEMLCSLWRLMNGYSNQYNNRVFIGGMGRANEAEADRFALLAIEATRKVRMNQPQLSMRFYQGQNPELWERAIDAIGEGCTFPMLYNDDVNVAAVAEAFGVSREIAEQYTPFGCGEYVLSHYSTGSPNGVINLLKALEVALRGGYDPVGKRQVAQVPPTSELSTFEDVWQAYATVAEAYVEALAVQERIEYDVTDAEVPMLFASMLTSDCIARGRGAFGGGARYRGGTLETYGNTNAADSLRAIQQLVFERGEVSLPELVDALDENFEGGEALREKLASVPKYGNDDAAADAMARRVHEHICAVTRQQAGPAGLDSYLVVIINNWANTILGKATMASADGRGAGEPMANGNNPSSGSDVSGVTAFLNSIASLRADVHAGAVQNMKFSRAWFGQMRPKFDALLRTYFARGGTQAMITVLSRADLEAAMREPEKWGHLMVRVGGFSIRFVDLPEDAQRELLARTLH